MSEAGPWARAEAPGLDVAFVGRRGALFWLALKTGFFTVLTLGFYRFWMKTRLRRYYWASIRPGGHPMEYVGDPFEKLLGFFIAVVILTFYIGVLNLVLMFASFSIFNSSFIGYAASFAGVIPLWFYARYRARRYTLARTRWRAVRFGVEPGAWGYALLALWCWFLTIITLGALWPRMTFLLEKYRIDRTYFGSARLHQGGHWTMLYRAAWPFMISAAAALALALWFWLTPVFAEDAQNTEEGLGALFAELLEGETVLWNAVLNPQMFLLVPVVLSGMLFGAIWYNWTAKRMMANHKTADGVTFASNLSGFRVTFIYVMGNFIAYLMLVLGITALVVLAASIFAGNLAFLEEATGFENLDAVPQWLSFSVLALLYLSFFLLWGVLYNTFVTFPLMRHMAETLRLPEVAGLSRISQRERDAFREAEGFAEALDLGAAI